MPSHAGRNAPARRSRSSTRAPAPGVRATTPRRSSRRSTRRWTLRGRGAAHPRRLPAQLRLRGRRDPPEVADRAHPRAARRRGNRRRGSRAAPRLGARAARSGRHRAGREGDQGGAGRDREVPPAPRGHRGRRRHAGALVRGAPQLIEAAGGGKRLGICLDSCHLLASGYDVRTRRVALRRARRVRPHRRPGPAALAARQRLSDPLGSNRDRHVNLGEGEIGADGIAAFLSEPRFDGLPVRVRGPGRLRQGRRAPGHRERDARCASAAFSSAARSGRRTMAAARSARRRRSTTPGARTRVRPGERRPGARALPARLAGRRTCSSHTCSGSIRPSLAAWRSSAARPRVAARQQLVLAALAGQQRPQPAARLPLRGW